MEDHVEDWWCRLGFHAWGKWQKFGYTFQERFCQFCNKRQIK